MCGIVGAIAQRNIIEILIDGLKKLEYRGYDSAGIALLTDGEMSRLRRVGKVAQLELALKEERNFPKEGKIGIGHTRWATHGEPNEANTHPHFSNNIAVVHNGIIENFEPLRIRLKSLGYIFQSDTDTEVIAHLVDHELKTSETLLEAVQKSTKQLVGAYGMVVMSKFDDQNLIVARSGSPLVIGKGIGEMFVASDQMALLSVTRKFLFLEEGDVAQVSINEVKIFDLNGKLADREFTESDFQNDVTSKGHFRHFMMKEIFEQPKAIESTIEGRLLKDTVAIESFGTHAKELFTQIKAVQIVACGTSFHAAMVARYWIESMANIPCQVEIASEFRYRKNVVLDDSLFITISQSGETADTLAALRLAKEQGFLTSLSICNVPGSSLVRESDMAFMTRAGAEIGVASSKAFTTQLAALLMLTTALSQAKKTMSADKISEIVNELKALPKAIEEVLKSDEQISMLAPKFNDKHHCLFLGRGEQYPIAMEGALKLKEISYIHAEGYAAGELKHGPLALIDSDMPVVVVAPNNELLEKLKSNMHEVSARGGELFVFTDADTQLKSQKGLEIITCSIKNGICAPILFTIPLQLLSYHVAVIKGTDIDQPRNLAKSVTVE